MKRQKAKSYRWLVRCGLGEFRSEIKHLSYDSLEWLRGRVSQKKEIALLAEFNDRIDYAAMGEIS